MGCRSRRQSFLSTKIRESIGVIARATRARTGTKSLRGLFAVPIVLLAATLAAAGGKNKLSYGEGLIVNIPLAPSEVEQVVTDISQNGLIRGSKEYNKDEFISGAKPSSSSAVFPSWNEGGKVFYKVREGAIDPRNFKDSGDVGTLAVRYVVQPQGDKNTVLRIDALFKEDFRRTVHQSDGSVESAEYKDIREHLEAIEVMKQQTEEANRERAELQKKKRDFVVPKGKPVDNSQGAFPVGPSSVPDPSLVAESSAAPDSPPESSSSSTSQSLDVHSSEASPSEAPPPEAAAPIQPPPSPPASTQSLEDHVKDLRKQVERLVKAPGAPLKSAPFHTASTLQSLTAGTEVLILISTPYWYGVETHDGQHGWMQRDELEQP
jgi:hypothetical protein